MNILEALKDALIYTVYVQYVCLFVCRGASDRPGRKARCLLEYSSREFLLAPIYFLNNLFYSDMILQKTNEGGDLLRWPIRSLGYAALDSEYVRCQAVSSSSRQNLHLAPSPLCMWSTLWHHTLLACVLTYVHHFKKLTNERVEQVGETDMGQMDATTWSLYLSHQTIFHIIWSVFSPLVTFR